MIVSAFNSRVFSYQLATKTIDEPGGCPVDSALDSLATRIIDIRLPLTAAAPRGSHPVLGIVFPIASTRVSVMHQISRRVVFHQIAALATWQQLICRREELIPHLVFLKLGAIDTTVSTTSHYRAITPTIVIIAKISAHSRLAARLSW
jgi:hypothetical protein